MWYEPHSRGGSCHIAHGLIPGASDSLIHPVVPIREPGWGVSPRVAATIPAPILGPRNRDAEKIRIGHRAIRTHMAVPASKQGMVKAQAGGVVAYPLWAIRLGYIVWPLQPV